MNITKVEYGERYSDDSGWERRVEVDLHHKSVEIDIEGSHMSIDLEEAWWVVKALLQAREALGMDKLSIGELSQGKLPSEGK